MCPRYYAGEKLKRRTGIAPTLHFSSNQTDLQTPGGTFLFLVCNVTGSRNRLQKKHFICVVPSYPKIFKRETQMILQKKIMVT